MSESQDDRAVGAKYPLGTPIAAVTSGGAGSSAPAAAASTKSMGLFSK